MNPKPIQHFPTDMKRYGLNPYGEPIWRVVWGESVFYQAGTPGGDLQWLPTYGIPVWVLEKWLPAEKFAGTRQQWELDERASGIRLGTYPSQGEYATSFLFMEGAKPYEPTAGAIEKVINLIRAGESLSFIQKRAALQAEVDRKREAQEKRGIEIYKESQGPFGHNPVAGIPSKKRPEDMRLDIAAEDLNLPVGDGKFFGGIKKGS
jgi:hypothetical protein